MLNLELLQRLLQLLHQNLASTTTSVMYMGCNEWNFSYVFGVVHPKSRHRGHFTVLFQY
ncbi:hypothetical protein A2U01_0007810, partial [Trifolium medium]|nr:hypothetical protein [Trifolium medium]